MAVMFGRAVVRGRRRVKRVRRAMLKGLIVWLVSEEEREWERDDFNSSV